MPQPELIWRRSQPGCKLSIILLDWGVRESFHSLTYLQNQTVARDQYEVLWLEFYKNKPQTLRDMLLDSDAESPPIDQWLIAGYDDDVLYNKHRLYNLGLLFAQGHICVFCDSDAIFTSNFVAKILAWFEQNPRSVLHLDEIRNNDRRFYPFAYPSVEEILGPGCINWHGTVSAGLAPSEDMLHDANYGACMAARRDDLLAIGGADEHLDYLGYVCGPYDMTFRLINQGLVEHWLSDEYLYHVWHPNQSGHNTEHHGPHDGRFMSLRSLEAKALGRVRPALENSWIARARQGMPLALDQLLEQLACQDEPTWRSGCQPPPEQDVFTYEVNFHGFNIFMDQKWWFGLKVEEGTFDPSKARRYGVLLQGKSLAEIRHLVHYYNALPTIWWKRLAAQPLYRLPARLAQRVGKEIARLF